MDEILKSDTFKTVYALAVFVISLVLTVKVYRKDIDGLSAHALSVNA